MGHALSAGYGPHLIARSTATNEMAASQVMLKES